ncbi:MAG: DUF1573 domain-containing protein [Bacteroidales bacterium]|jgi:hypothetical protein|nr:DUF1573 domain-containing protein [Bacteroidales bacterium]
MKKIASILLVMILACGVFAQEKTSAVDNKNAPVMTFDARYVKNDRMVHDYGTVEKGGDGQCYFAFTNTGKEPIIIEKATSSCGCTVPNPPIYPILPGQRDSISVKYDTKKVGAINKTINVLSNAANSPVILYISGNVVNIEASSAIPENKSGNNSVMKQASNY